MKEMLLWYNVDFLSFCLFACLIVMIFVCKAFVSYLSLLLISSNYISLLQGMNELRPELPSQTSGSGYDFAEELKSTKTTFTPR